MVTDEHWLDQFLGGQMGEATREEVLKALRDHVLGTVVVELEVPGQEAALLHLRGALVEADRDPDTWETAETFAVVSSNVAALWHNVGPTWDAYFTSEQAQPWQREAYMAAGEDHWPRFRVPQTGVEQYLGVMPSAAGYRFDLGGGAKLAIVLWHDLMHVTGAGDLAPGVGPLRVEIKQSEDDDHE